MCAEDHCPPLVVILGPTAVGKTETAIQVAESLDGEIVSADSRLLYRSMDIGTAKPTLEELARVPHHLIDVTGPNEVWSLAVYQRRAYRAISEIHARGRLPFLVGGTGQYIRAVVEGWTIPAVKSDPRLREVLEDWAEEIGPHGLHERLAILDPQAAANIDFRNLRRTVRALEVILRTGRRFSAQRRRQPRPFCTLQIGLIRPRAELYARVDARIRAMLVEGLIGEVTHLLEQGYSSDLPTLSAIGYREIVGYLEGEISLDEAVALIKRHTRQFVRRQANWFKPEDPDIHWIQAGPQAAPIVEGKVREWLEEIGWKS
jgi:tRNA dimethylallyltransferase